MKDTKEKLLETAYGLVQQKGINGMSYRDLSEALGIRKASIHYHLPKKEDMVEALIDRCDAADLRRYAEIAGLDETPESKLLRIAAFYAAGIRSGRLCIIGIMSAEQDSLNKSCDNKLKQAINRRVSVFSRIFREAADRGELKEGTDCEDTARAFLSLLIGGQMIGKSAGSADPFNRSIETFLSLVF